jgi:hypothetical protein
LRRFAASPGAANPRPDWPLEAMAEICRFHPTIRPAGKALSFDFLFLNLRYPASAVQTT